MAKQNLEGRRVLLAEDNEINTFVARRILESKGIIVEHAENGKRAVEWWSRIRRDILTQS